MIPWLNAAPTGPTSGAEVVALFQNITNWMFVSFMLVAVIFIVLAAFQFVSSGGDPNSVTQAKSKLFWASIGIIAALLSRGIPIVVSSILGV